MWPLPRNSSAWSTFHSVHRSLWLLFVVLCVRTVCKQTSTCTARLHSSSSREARSQCYQCRRPSAVRAHRAVPVRSQTETIHCTAASAKLDRALLLNLVLSATESSLNTLHSNSVMCTYLILCFQRCSSWLNFYTFSSNFLSAGDAAS